MGTQLPQKSTAPNIFGPYLLRPNGCMDQHATWYGGRPQPTRLCVRLHTAKRSSPNAPELTFLAQKTKKNSGEGHSPVPTAHLPRRRLHLWRLDPMALDLGAFGCPPDLLTSPPHFHTPSTPMSGAKEPAHRAKDRGSKSSRE